MATRDELYAKFGITAEAAQLFETELGTLLLCAQGLEKGWHITPDSEMAQAALTSIERSTLGQLLASLKSRVDISDSLQGIFASALQTRNLLNHGFFERHNFKIQTDEGRDAMIADLEVLHDELFRAWQVAGAMTAIAVKVLDQTRRANGAVG